MGSWYSLSLSPSLVHTLTTIPIILCLSSFYCPDDDIQRLPSARGADTLTTCCFWTESIHSIFWFQAIEKAVPSSSLSCSSSWKSVSVPGYAQAPPLMKGLFRVTSYAPYQVSQLWKLPHIKITWHLSLYIYCISTPNPQKNASKVPDSWNSFIFITVSVAASTAQALNKLCSSVPFFVNPPNLPPTTSNLVTFEAPELLNTYVPFSN